MKAYLLILIMMKPYKTGPIYLVQPVNRQQVHWYLDQWCNVKDTVLDKVSVFSPVKTHEEHICMTVPSIGDCGGDTSDTGDWGAPWQTSFRMNMYT